MTLSKLSFVLILLVLSLVLSVQPLTASDSQKQNAPQNSSNSEFSNPPETNSASSHHKATAKQRGTKDNPLFVQTVNPAKTDKEAAQEQKEHDEKLSLDRQTISLNKETVGLNKEMTRFTGYLACLALFQFIVLIIQAGILWRQTGFNSEQITNQRVIERAYVKMSHWPPGLNFAPIPGNFWISLKVTNFGMTPATITGIAIKNLCLLASLKLPDIPDYSSSEMQPVTAFVVPNDFVSTTVQGIFESSDFRVDEITEAIRNGRARFIIFGYVDYIDVFEKRHRAGYAREYNPRIDEQDGFSRREYAQRSNLIFVPEPNYNYDRQRQNGEGDDWDKSF